MKIKILIPVFNDWQSVSKLTEEINSLPINPEHIISLIIVNDASNHDRPDDEKNFENIQSIKILNMKKNQGHARCIATGLKYILEKEDFDYVIPMDGDGEDRPEEIVEFLSKIENSNGRTIVGERIKRSENLIFQICYQLHKLLTLTFAGKSIKFGNFTCLPKSSVEKMVNEKATWNSFSGSLRKIEDNLMSIPSKRGERYFGPSKMSFYKLLIHSFSIISVFKKQVLIRSVIFFSFLYFLKDYLSNATIIAQSTIVIFNFLIFLVSLRENKEELINSQDNLTDIRDLTH